MGLPPSLVHAAHFTDMEVEDAASTVKMVGVEGTNVCVMASKSYVQSWLPNPTLLQEKWHTLNGDVYWYCSKWYASQLTSTSGEPRSIVYNVDQQQSYLRDHPGQVSSRCCVTFLYYQILRKQNTEPNAHPYVYFTSKPLPSQFTRISDMHWCC